MYLDAKTETPNKILIDPLTRRDANGEIYRRSSEVEEQILEALRLEQSILLGRVAIMDYDAPGYFKEEAIVYLIRKFIADRETDLVNDLMNHLIQRVAVPVHCQISKILHREYYVDECYRDVLLEVTRKITDLTSDCDDFAQARFQKWLERITFKAIRPYFREQEQDKNREPEIEILKNLPSSSPSAEDDLILAETHKLDLKKAQEFLEKLPEHERNAYLLRYRDGLEIENQDPSIMTISKHFNRSPRTIRNWLRAAEDKLQKARGD